MFGLKLSRADADCYRVKRDEMIVGFALRMSNDTWRLFGPDMAQKITAKSYPTPKAALADFPAAFTS